MGTSRNIIQSPDNVLSAIVNGDQLAEDAAYTVFGQMVFPGDLVTAERIALAIREDFESVGDYTRVSDLGRKTFLTHMNSGRLCGNIAIQIVRNYLGTGDADILKARYVVSEWAHSQKTREGKSVPSDERNLKKHFSKFKPVVHLWAAQEVLLVDRNYKGREGTLPAILASEKELALLLKVAAWFELELSSLIDDWQPVRIPKVFKEEVRLGRIQVTLPPNPPEIEEILKTYQNKNQLH